MSEKMIIYHGSAKIIEKPVFGMGNPNNDYGLGFYCTESEELAKATLEKCNYHCKTAIVMILLDCDAQKAASLLESANGRIAEAIKSKEN